MSPEQIKTMLRMAQAQVMYVRALASAHGMSEHQIDEALNDGDFEGAEEWADTHPGQPVTAAGPN